MIKNKVQIIPRICCFRLSPALHAELKSHIYSQGQTIEKWMTIAIEEKLTREKTNRSAIWLCEDCGHWSLKGTQIAMLGICGKCHKEKATFPC